MSTRRMERIDQLLKRELSDIVRRGVKDPRVGFVTVTGVEVSRDLSHARVYVSVMGDPEAKRNTMEGMASAAGYIQRELGERVRLKFLPHLQFVLDESADRGFRIEEILRKIEEEKGHAPEERPERDRPADPGT